MRGIFQGLYFDACAESQRVFPASCQQYSQCSRSSVLLSLKGARITETDVNARNKRYYIMPFKRAPLYYANCLYCNIMACLTHATWHSAWHFDNFSGILTAFYIPLTRYSVLICVCVCVCVCACVRVRLKRGDLFNLLPIKILSPRSPRVLGGEDSRYLSLSLSISLSK